MPAALRVVPGRPLTKRLSWMLRVFVITVGCITTWIPLPSLLAQQRDLRLLEAVKRRDQKAFTALLRATLLGV